MQLEIQRRPRSRGVSQLMYVGDDEAVENAVRVPPIAIAGLAALAIWWLTRKRR